MNAQPTATAGPAPGEEKKQGKEKAPMWTWIRDLLLMLVVVLVIRSFVFSVITVDGKSMQETLLDGDRLYVSLLTARLEGYRRGDVVICYYPGRSDRCVKRVVALPGETVEISGGRVFVNGEALAEDYLAHPANYSQAPLTLGEGEYYVLGDNRPVSHDSHSGDVGPVRRLEGKVRFILWPLDRLGWVK